MILAAAAYPLSDLADFAAYAEKISTWVADAADQGADLLVFPEYASLELASLSPRAVSQDIEAALHAVAAHQTAVDALHCELAARHGVYILGGSAPVFDPAYAPTRPVNRATFYGPGGVLGHQDKQVMTRFERAPWDVVPGGPLRLFQTPLGKIGVLICYDSEFPLLGRALVQAGAEIILVPSCTDSHAGFTRVRVGAMARALEGQCVTVHAPTVGFCDFCPAVDENVGAASIYGPPDRGFPSGGILAETALNRAGWAMAKVDLAAIHAVRADGSVLNHAHWGESAGRAGQRVEIIKIS